MTIKAERRESTDSDVAPMDMEDMEDDEDVASVSKHRQQQQRSVSPPKLASLLDMSRPQNTQQRPASFPRRADLMTPPSTPKSKQLGKRRAAAAPSSHSNSALVSSVGGVASRGLADALGAISPYLSVVGGSPSLRPRVRAISDSPVHFNTSPPRPRLSNGIGKHQQLQLPKISPPADTDMSAGFASHAQPMAQAASRLPDLPEVRPPDDISNGVGHGDHMSQTSADTSGSVLSHKDGRVREFHDFISQNRYKMIIVCTVCHHANAVDKSQVTMDSAIKCIKCKNLLLNLGGGPAAAAAAGQQQQPEQQPAASLSPSPPPRPLLSQVRPPSLTNVMPPPPTDDMPDMSDVLPPAATPPVEEDTHMATD